MPTDRRSTFSFVDRIISIDNKGLIIGCCTIPATLNSFPQCLVAEAIGQLAAWYAMKSQAFAYRPVAALAGATLYHSEALPGEKLDLFVQIESCDAGAICYSGYARIGKRLVMELKDCTGAMLPQRDFDDPANVKTYFKLLVTDGVKNNIVDPTTCLAPTELHVDALHCLRGRLDVPLYADFFHDHFPNKPVFPATLLIHVLTGMVTSQISSSNNRNLVRILSVEDVKVRAWMYPGDHLQLTAEACSRGRSPCLFKIKTHRDGTLIATAKLKLYSSDISIAA